MEVLSDIKALREWRSEDGRAVVLVPTMGALHAGHMTLISEARQRVGKAGRVIVSIFVNPTQFDRKDDLEHYPRTVEEDLASCEAGGVDAVFMPAPSEIYYSDATVSVVEEALSETLCGAKRPGHFNGVCTVVQKLFNLVQPEEAVFGKKDFQQLAIIRRMVRDLNIPVEIIGVETVREESGLALSSRNALLTTVEHAEASMIYATLGVAKERLESGTLSVAEYYQFFTEALHSLEAETKVDYVELVHAETLRRFNEGDRGAATLAVAIFFGKVRLIDHISVDLI